MVGVRSHLLRHCRDGHWMGRRTDGHGRAGLPESGGFHPDLIFWEMLSSAVMLLVVAPPASIVASRITPIFFLLLSRRKIDAFSLRQKQKAVHLLGRAGGRADGLDVDVDAIGVLTRRKKENILFLPESEQD